MRNPTWGRIRPSCAPRARRIEGKDAFERELLKLNQMRTPNSTATDRVFESDSRLTQEGLGEILVENVAEQVRVTQRAVSKHAVRSNDPLPTVLPLFERASESHPVERIDEVPETLGLRGVPGDRLGDLSRHSMGRLDEEGTHEPLPLPGQELVDERIEDHLVPLREKFLTLLGQDVSLSRPTYPFSVECGQDEAPILHSFEVTSSRTFLDPQLEGQVPGGARGHRELFEDLAPSALQDHSIYRVHGCGPLRPSLGAGRIYTPRHA
jgi:hypothetical protein